MFAKSFVALAVAAASVLGQQINTPASLTVCQPTLLSWSGGQAPYFLSVIPGGQASAAALKDFGEQNDNSETWTVDLAAGTSITLKLTDSTGNTVYSSPVTIGEGTSTSCLNAAGSSSAASGSSAASSSTGAAAGASSAVSSAASSASSAASSAVSSASSAAASATSARASSAAGSSSASGVRSAASSAASGVSSAASSAAAAATSPASGASKLVVSGLGAIVLSAVGVALA
ncbi:hypothetical protein NliqN6_3616 [Naganishia liquefaciens]|uniref:Uncharacterized protein n=1 Tax=Naganishia liquefaciens TaxID=104408 RepID=A0A8H3TVZ9_9TREE|nr:hypothetical protein NliqN6_3616 [Naganishia liquefaciens]